MSDRAARARALNDTAARLRSTGGDFDARLADALDIESVNVEFGGADEIDPLISRVTADRLRQLDAL